MSTFEQKARKVEQEHRRDLSGQITERLVRELKKAKVSRYGFGTFRVTKRTKNKIINAEGESVKVPHYYVSFRQSASLKRALQPKAKKV
jgi:nucleoid DNA-binding protein